MKPRIPISGVVLIAAALGFSPVLSAQPQSVPQPVRGNGHDHRNGEGRNDNDGHREDEHRGDAHRGDTHRDDAHRDGRRDEERREGRRDERREAEMRERLEQREARERAERAQHRHDMDAWRATRDRRAEEHRREIRESYGEVLTRDEARNELATHADRMARLNYILDIAQDNGNVVMAARVQAAVTAENVRHARVMEEIRWQAGVR
jgi:hypothetical protein